MKRYISYILTVALLLLLGGSVVMACNNCSSLKWTVLEIRSQEDLAKVLEQVNLSEVQASSVNLSVLNEIELNGNGTAYILIPAPSQDPCDEPVKWSCIHHHCPNECPICFDYLDGWSDFHGNCNGIWRICCPTGSHEWYLDEHGCKAYRCT